jgi:hypothetical protein
VSARALITGRNLLKLAYEVKLACYSSTHTIIGVVNVTSIHEPGHLANVSVLHLVPYTYSLQPDLTLHSASVCRTMEQPNMLVMKQLLALKALTTISHHL